MEIIQSQKINVKYKNTKQTLKWS